MIIAHLPCNLYGSDILIELTNNNRMFQFNEKRLMRLLLVSGEYKL